MSNGEGPGNGAAPSEGAAGQTNLGGATGETPAELESRAKELQATPGYISGELKNSNPEGYKKLQEKITDMFRRSGQAEVPGMQAASEADMQKAEAATKLITEANTELAALKTMGFEQAPLPDPIEPFHIEAWRSQRLLAGGNYAELQPLLESGLRDIETPPSHVQALSMFLDGDDFDPELRQGITEQIVEFIFTRKHLAAKARGAL